MVAPVTKTALLFATVIALFVAIGGLLGDFLIGSVIGGLAVALGFALIFNLISYFLCDRFVLWSTHAKIVGRDAVPRLTRLVDELAPQFGLVHPRLALVPTDAPNAFATGRDERHAIVAVTEGILHLLDDRELRGVLAHELAHIKDRDILVMTFAATLAGAISYLGEMFLFQQMFGGNSSGGRGNSLYLMLIAAITAPIAALLIQLAISRSRELHADEVGARTIRDPEALARALEKLEAGATSARRPAATPATASLCIVNPLRGRGLGTLFSTHPPLAERIRRLREMPISYQYQIPGGLGGGRPTGARAYH